MKFVCNFIRSSTTRRANSVKPLAILLTLVASPAFAQVVSIHNIQYTTDPAGDSPYSGQAGVTTEGIVTAVYYDGYFIEDPGGGAWNGLSVHDSNSPSLGDHVRLTGTVNEYYNLTELRTLTGYEVLSAGNDLPAPKILFSGSVAQEQWEGVLVRVENVTVTNGDLGYGEWSVNDGSGDVVIDDKGSYTYSPSTGDQLASIIGPLDYSYGAFKIQPRDDNDIMRPLPHFRCVGFSPPLDTNDPLRMRRTRSIPLRAQLHGEDEQGYEVEIDGKVLAGFEPLAQITPTATNSNESSEASDIQLPVSESDVGDQFYFIETNEGYWQLILDARNYKTPDVLYEIKMIAHPDGEYEIDPTCAANFEYVPH